MCVRSEFKIYETVSRYVAKGAIDVKPYVHVVMLSLYGIRVRSRMATKPQKSPKPKRNGTGENFDRLTKSLIGKCDKLRKKHRADVYPLIKVIKQRP